MGYILGIIGMLKGVYCLSFGVLFFEGFEMFVIFILMFGFGVEGVNMVCFLLYYFVFFGFV